MSGVKWKELKGSNENNSRCDVTRAFFVTYLQGIFVEKRRTATSHPLFLACHLPVDTHHAGR